MSKSQPSLHDDSNGSTKALPNIATVEKDKSQEGEQSEEGEESAQQYECVCSFFEKNQIPNATLEEYQREQLKEAPLFTKILTLDDKELVCIERPPADADTSILVTGFGIRNLKSLQNIVDLEQRKRLYEFLDTQIGTTNETEEEEFIGCSSSPPSSKIEASRKPSWKSSWKSSSRSIETGTDTDFSTLTSDISIQKEKVQYLMGLQADEEEGEAYPREEDLVKQMFATESEDKFIFSQTSTIRAAQEYLRTHRIFDFFQFLITHILSAAPENPVTFLLVLLNKILLYRAGTGSPPLLYEQKHIEQLFKLMDRMNTGYIDLKQYESGMKTLAICEYNKKPQLSAEGLVSRKVFIQEALESQTALFNDLIKRKWIGSKPKLQGTFSDISSLVRSYTSGFNLLPSDLLLRCQKQEKIEENEEG